MTIIALNCIHCDLIPLPTNPVVVGPEKGKLRRDTCLYMAQKCSFPHLGSSATKKAALLSLTLTWALQKVLYSIF